MKSTEEHRALQLLDQAGDYANRAETLTVVDDREVNLIRAVCGVGLAVIAACEEVRESRAEMANALAIYRPVMTSTSCAQLVPQAPRVSDETPDRSARGHLMLAFLAMAGTIVLLVVLCVVLALT
jgi:hypothetical protein